MQRTLRTPFALRFVEIVVSVLSVKWYCASLFEADN